MAPSGLHGPERMPMKSSTNRSGGSALTVIVVCPQGLGAMFFFIEISLSLCEATTEKEPLVETSYIVFL